MWPCGAPGRPPGAHKCGQCPCCVTRAHPILDTKVLESSIPGSSSDENPKGHHGEKFNLGCGLKVCRGPGTSFMTKSSGSRGSKANGHWQGPPSWRFCMDSAWRVWQGCVALAPPIPAFLLSRSHKAWLEEALWWGWCRQAAWLCSLPAATTPEWSFSPGSRGSIRRQGAQCLLLAPSVPAVGCRCRAMALSS